MFDYDLLGRLVVFVAIIFGIGYLFRYINDNWFGGKALRKYYEKRKKDPFWRHRG